MATFEIKSSWKFLWTKQRIQLFQKTHKIGQSFNNCRTWGLHSTEVAFALFTQQLRFKSWLGFRDFSLLLSSSTVEIQTKRTLKRLCSKGLR